MNLKWIHVSLALIALVLVFTEMPPGLGQNNESEGSMYWFMQGLSLYNQDKFSESLEAYETALQLDPTNSEAWNNRGIDEGLLGMYDDALTSFENALAINQSYAEAWYNMGVVYDLKDDPYTALQAYKMATRIDPEYQKAWIMRNSDTDIIMAPSLSCACQNQPELV